MNSRERKMNNDLSFYGNKMSKMEINRDKKEIKI